MVRQYSWLDRLLIEADEMLQTLLGEPTAARVSPAASISPSSLSTIEKRTSQGYMRVNHTGEVCAQALYRAQMLLARDEETYALLSLACREEVDHLAWTQHRLMQLGAKPSALNLFWYGQSFFLGMAAAMLGDAWSLGFVEETERQVSAHLTQHLDRLPERDLESRAIVRQMRQDEEAHGEAAKSAGGQALPFLFQQWMRLQSKVMTTLVYYI